MYQNKKAVIDRDQRTALPQHISLRERIFINNFCLIKREKFQVNYITKMFKEDPENKRVFSHFKNHVLIRMKE